jgi:hypothetical protein
MRIHNRIVPQHLFISFSITFQVKCGQTARKKRSTDGTVHFYFDITAEFDDATFKESFAQFRRDQSEIKDKIMEAKAAGMLDFNISQIALMEATDIDNFDVVLECPENTIPSYKTTSCGESYLSRRIYFTCIC